MEMYDVFLDLAIIVAFAKAFAILARKLHAPQVAGEIIAGLVIGPSMLGLVQPTDFLNTMAEIGVLLLMFSAGLTTDLQELKKTGAVAFLIACAGVIVPLILGAALYMAFYGYGALGSERFYRALFSGCIMTATSVSITVQALREMGHLRGRVGQTILSAAIIDDVIGIVLLTVIIGFKSPDANLLSVLLSVGLFFLIVGVGGYLVYRVFKVLDLRHPHTQRIPIWGLALCFLLAYCSEHFFGIADITGAYMAGIILCSIDDSAYIERKMDINSYMLFGPVFFASIGLKTDISGMNSSVILFSIAFIVVALAGKIIGCGLMARICRYSKADSLKIGVGMMNRGEVALIVAQKGLAVGMMDANLFAAVIPMIVISAIVTPIGLKILYSKWPEAAAAA